ncbi:hypothetical protein N0V93_009731 [Gnomoniopsis smithogilvyi]|uniref:chitinase n=1 Tax=Gnomoniopsis smithogilvyi TaxID=1191159 RepID=A0A9W9CTY4_9PEZI|nr:hypothetical protein N0V93_009731 [Gnomoniopsis smithogilvyi]
MMSHQTRSLLTPSKSLITNTLLRFLSFLSLPLVSSSIVGDVDSRLDARQQESRLEALDINSLFTPLLTRQTASTNSSGQDGYTCGPDSPCSNGACCGESGWCGYGPTYCGDGCQSNCDATASCGEYAADVGQLCPLNVCCSQYGFCGTTADFCDTGCQSNCDQPEPSAATSNVQSRIVGYWEAWNSEHACGTMNPSQIPVNLLTHLNVAFGYISPSTFEVINMDGVSPDIYQTVGNVKSINPSLKIIIAIGGWSFNDPGTYQEVFPTMVSTEANRALFITNLLGFLSQYGYDGVAEGMFSIADILPDWEYPGADDRGGSDVDGINYTALLKELRAAIDASGNDYIITFTAPTSYWYLQHFDIENMYPYADWINLMSYDLHGVWDSSDPIGNQVLAHTNLTEIDLALDLFWRAGVDPSAIVLGLGFYGRSFTLEDSSCWKPGCAFSGAGAAGSCTGTAGILSYREIMQILSDTGATSYLDTTDAVRYLVYDDNSWISYDDATTFQMKIDFANSKGLSGLMVWAVDLDDASSTALHAISNSSALGAVANPFTLVDLAYLFPTEYLPDNDTTPYYGLVNIGSSADAGSIDPTQGGFGFFLVAGESFAVSKLRRRDGEPEPFTFLDCPEDPVAQNPEKLQTARVVCLSEDVEGCFRVMEKGVEGTIIEMPDNCAKDTFARAVSLNMSDNQQIPAEIRGKRTPTSVVFDFSFDYNMDLLRRDSTQVSVRMDYSNVEGYWKSIVDSPGVQSRDLKNRYFGPVPDWEALLDQVGSVDGAISTNNSAKINEDVSAPLFWEAATEECVIDGDSYGEGFGAYVSGTIDATFYYGFSTVAIVVGGNFVPFEASGMLSARGSTDLTYTIGGVGAVNIAKYNGDNPVFAVNKVEDIGGESVDAGVSGSYVNFTPYYGFAYQMATTNGTDGEQFSSDPGADFDGILSTRIITDLGSFIAAFPITDTGTEFSQNGAHTANKIEIGADNVLYDTKGTGGQIAVGTYLFLGLAVDFSYPNYLAKSYWTKALANMTLTTNTMTAFSFYPASEDNDQASCAGYDVITVISQSVDNPESVGWSDDVTNYDLVYDRQSPSSGPTCYTNAHASKKSRRSGDPTHMEQESYANDTLASTSLSLRDPGTVLDPRQVNSGGELAGWGLLAGAAFTYKLLGSGAVPIFDSQKPKFNCRGTCLTCDFDDDTTDDVCLCGCKSMDFVFGYTDIPNCDACDCVNDPADPSGSNCDDGTWPSVAVGLSKKKSSDLEAALDSNTINPETLLEDDETYHTLDERVYGVATISTKKVTVCGSKVYGAGDYRYPAFPAPVGNPWDGIEGGKWDGVSRYWGNSSASCINWGVAQSNAADTVFIAPGQSVRAKYQTEHVFEGQLIGDFFSQWLATGKVNNQNPDPGTTATIIPCTWVSQYILSVPAGSTFTLDGTVRPFIQLLLAELGSIAHLDRLTIFMARPNRKKGSMFTGNQPTSPTTFATMTSDEQLTSAKEMGMIFNYLNTQAVWDSFCGSYEAIYDLMGDFDTWYAANGAFIQSHGVIGVPSLQSEWKTYIRTSLDSMVRRSRSTYDTMAVTGILTINPWAITQWGVNTLLNRGSIQLSLTCNNMDASTA